MNEYVHLYSVN